MAGIGFDPITGEQLSDVERLLYAGTALVSLFTLGLGGDALRLGKRLLAHEGSALLDAAARLFSREGLHDLFTHLGSVAHDILDAGKSLLERGAGLFESGLRGALGNERGAIRLGRDATDAVERLLTSLANEIRTSGLSAVARNQRTIAVGADVDGRLFAGSSNGFDPGMRAALERLGITRVPGSEALHAEEELLRGVSNLARVGTSVRYPCGPAEHNCLQQLIDRGVEIEP